MDWHEVFADGTFAGAKKEGALVGKTKLYSLEFLVLI